MNATILEKEYLYLNINIFLLSIRTRKNTIRDEHVLRSQLICMHILYLLIFSLSFFPFSYENKKFAADILYRAKLQKLIRIDISSKHVLRKFWESFYRNQK